jgi:hypothetical protein
VASSEEPSPSVKVINEPRAARALFQWAAGLAPALSVDAIEGSSAATKSMLMMRGLVPPAELPTLAPPASPGFVPTLPPASAVPLPPVPG